MRHKDEYFRNLLLGVFVLGGANLLGRVGYYNALDTLRRLNMPENASYGTVQQALHPNQTYDGSDSYTYLWGSTWGAAFWGAVIGGGLFWAGLRIYDWWRDRGPRGPRW